MTLRSGAEQPRRPDAIGGAGRPQADLCSGCRQQELDLEGEGALERCGLQRVLHTVASALVGGAGDPMAAPRSRAGRTPGVTATTPAPAIARLRPFNLVAGVLHLAQAVAMVVL